MFIADLYKTIQGKKMNQGVQGGYKGYKGYKGVTRDPEGGGELGSILFGSSSLIPKEKKNQPSLKIRGEREKEEEEEEEEEERRRKKKKMRPSEKMKRRKETTKFLVRRFLSPPFFRQGTSRGPSLNRCL